MARKSKKVRSAAMKAAWARRKAEKAFDARISPGSVSGLLKAPEAPQPIRAQILDAAKALTMGDRNKLYGNPMDTYRAHSKLSEAFWSEVIEQEHSPWRACMELVLTKLARIASAPNREARLHADHYKDAINYLAIALEVSDPSRV